MNSIDGSDHYSKTSEDPPPSLLTIILDTNPHAWALLAPTLTLTDTIASLLVFINAHLAFSNANKVAIIASHTQRAEFLYPESISPRPQNNKAHPPTSQNGLDRDGDEDMADGEDGTGPRNGHSDPSPPAKADADTATTADASADADANHYGPFRQIERTLLRSLLRLLQSTSAESLTPTTSIAGALTLALTYINKQQTLLANAVSTTTTSSATTTTSSSSTITPAAHEAQQTLTSRILILSVSGDLAHQYIPIMNTIFACQRLAIPIDIAKLAGDTVFLQQASDATGGVYIALQQPRGILQYLMMGFLADGTGRRSLVGPTAVGVDFRAACFCHRRVVDVGFVCSICLSIFCEVPEGAVCLTCGTHLRLGEYGGRPAVVAKKKKKRKV